MRKKLYFALFFTFLLTALVALFLLNASAATDAFEVYDGSKTTCYSDTQLGTAIAALPATGCEIRLMRDVTLTAPVTSSGKSYTLTSKGGAHYSLIAAFSDSTYPDAYTLTVKGGDVTVTNLTIKADGVAKTQRGINVTAGVLRLLDGAVVEACFDRGVRVANAGLLIGEGASVYALSGVTTNGRSGDANGWHAGSIIDVEGTADFRVTGGMIGAKPDGTAAAGTFSQVVCISPNATVTVTGGTFKSDKNRVFYFQGNGAFGTTTMTGANISKTSTGDVVYIAGGYGTAINLVNCTVKGLIRSGSTSAGQVLTVKGGTYTAVGNERVFELNGKTELVADGATVTSAGALNSTDGNSQSAVILAKSGWVGNITLRNASVTGNAKLLYAESGSEGTFTVDGGTYRAQKLAYLQHTAYFDVTITGGAVVSTADIALHFCANDAAYDLEVPTKTLTVSGNARISNDANTLLYFGHFRAYDVQIEDATLIAAKGKVLSYDVMADNVKQGSVTIRRTNITVQSGTSMVLYFLTNNPIVLDEVTIRAAGYCVQTLASSTWTNGTYKLSDGGTTYTVTRVYTAFFDPTITITNCDFKSTGATDACISIEAGSCTINGGRYENNGLCTVRVLGGNCTAENIGAGAKINNYTHTESGGGKSFSYDGYFLPGGTVGTETLHAYPFVSTAKMTINDGVFINNSTVITASHSVVRVGGGSTYGWMTINGGTFVHNGTYGEQVVFKNNPNSVINLNGGIFLASAEQVWFFKTNGTGVVNGTDYPTDNIAVSDDFAPLVTFEGKQYNAYIRIDCSDWHGAPKMYEGAAVRINQAGNGLRFSSKISAAAMTELAKMSGTVRYGTIIVPTAYAINAVLKDGAFTHETLRDAGYTVFMDIPAVEGINENTDGTLTICAAISNIKSANNDLPFCAIAYACVTDGEGHETYYYAAFDSFRNSRSVSYVARRALYDKTCDYTAAQRAVLNGYINKHTIPTGTNALVPGATVTNATRLVKLQVLAERCGYSLAGTRDAGEKAKDGTTTYPATRGYFNVMQGGCTDGNGYLYYAIEWQCSGSNKEVSTHQIKILKYSIADNWIVACSEPLKLGHVNGFTYNSDTGKLVAIDNSTSTNRVAYLNPETLTITGTQNLPRGCSSIAYIDSGANKGNYMIGSGYNFWILNGSTFKTGSQLGGGEKNSDGSFKYTAKNDSWVQDGTVCGEYVYFARSVQTLQKNADGTTKNTCDWECIIPIYNLSGTYLGAVEAPIGGTDINNPTDTRREVENISIVGNSAYVAYHAGGLSIYELTISAP